MPAHQIGQDQAQTSRAVIQQSPVSSGPVALVTDARQCLVSRGSLQLARDMATLQTKKSITGLRLKDA